MDKRLYIIGGCNGAGKTTASYTVLPDILHCREFVNADEIAHGLSPFNPENVSIEAGRLMIHRINELLGREATFAVETTLATKSYVNLVHEAQSQGYVVTLVFFWLRTPELAMQRVAERVSNGGHNIPVPTTRRRYVSGINNLFNLYAPVVDAWFVYDNSNTPRIEIAHGGKAVPTTVLNEELFSKMKEYVG
ncbi:MAG: zeta toxin family protein [Bacteroidales bacterium]|nr:zeta toxin family protein [Bacteroidales bacterium]MBP5644477.1 zeta toxin family protein [Bacteroidales bacterium]